MGIHAELMARNVLLVERLDICTSVIYCVPSMSLSPTRAGNVNKIYTGSKGVLAEMTELKNCDSVIKLDWRSGHSLNLVGRLCKVMFVFMNSTTSD